MACCYVEIPGKDGKKHFLTVDAKSAFDAIEKAIRAWKKLGWFDGETAALVKRGEESWNIPVSRVIERRQQKNKHSGQVSGASPRE